MENTQIFEMADKLKTLQEQKKDLEAQTKARLRRSPNWTISSPMPCQKPNLTASPVTAARSI